MSANDQLELFADSDLESCTTSSGFIHAPETNASAWELCGRYIRTKIIPGDPDQGGVIVAGFCIHPTARNLRLMAAAPELLEALKESHSLWENLLYHLEEMGVAEAALNVKGTAITMETFAAMLGNTKAAIAKAEGRAE